LSSVAYFILVYLLSTLDCRWVLTKNKGRLVDTFPSLRDQNCREVPLLYIFHVIIFDCRGRIFHCHKYSIVVALSGFSLTTFLMVYITLLLKKLRVVLRHVDFIQADNGAVIASDKLLNSGESLFKWNVIHLQK
jgi:ACR3 family arsenite efflux pump ArsB